MTAIPPPKALEIFRAVALSRPSSSEKADKTAWEEEKPSEKVETALSILSMAIRGVKWC
jgi:hypothetical protein